VSRAKRVDKAKVRAAGRRERKFPRVEYTDGYAMMYREV